MKNQPLARFFSLDDQTWFNRAITVSEFIANINEALTLMPVVLIGEISELTIKQHRYAFFNLKDEKEDAVVNCYLSWQILSMPIENGMRAIIQGAPSIYPRSGRFSIVVSLFQLSGEGSLKKAYELLIDKLTKIGLFAPERKKPIPPFPKKIALISSSQAAGYGDFLKIINKHWPILAIDLYEVPVQGIEAEGKIIEALEKANLNSQADLIALIRGGGSIEDLAVFNSEKLANVIANSRLPVVVGVGHDRDQTIAGLVADLNAATPTQAAELIVPDKDQVKTKFSFLKTVIENSVINQIQNYKINLKDSEQEIKMSILQRLTNLKEQLNLSFKLIQATTPTEILKRGFSLTLNEEGQMLKSIKGLKINKTIRTVFLDGELKSTINKINSKNYG